MLQFNTWSCGGGGQRKHANGWQLLILALYFSGQQHYTTVHVYSIIKLAVFLHNREFDDPHPQEHVIRDSVGNFTVAVDRSLRKHCFINTVLRIPFRHDVVRFLFHDKDELTLEDFNNDYFPYGWNQWYKQHGNSGQYYGHTIVFPIRIACYLQWTRPNGFVKNSDGTVRPKQCTFIEMLRVYIVKSNC